MSTLETLVRETWILALAVVVGIVLAPRLAVWAAKAVLFVQARRGRAAPLYGDRRLGSTSVGRSGVAKTEIAPRGKVRLQGETWTAVTATDGPIAPGAPVEVVAVEGLTLTVRAVERDERSAMTNRP